MNLRNIVRQLLRLGDIQISRLSRSPEKTLLGLKNYPIRTVLDIGANLGQFAQFIQAHFGEADIFSFEPIPDTFAALKKRNIPRVTPIQLALGQENGSSHMWEHIDHSSSSSFLSATSLSHEYYPVTAREKSTAVEVATLDSVVGRLNIPVDRETLIKMDVQGFEDRVIRGGLQTFGKARASIVEICLETLYHEQATFRDIFALLEGLNFTYAGNLDQSYAADGRVVFIDAVFIRR